MSKCFIVGVSGGGSGKLFATIGVTYPEGSMLTCTDGTKTLNAKTTTGQWVFSIPYVGAWTVTATDGTETVSETVEITSEGQNVSVELSYELWLYKDGNKFTENTGGWSSCNGWSVAGLYTIDGQLTYGTNMYTDAVPQNKARGSITGLIDLTKYKELKFKLVNRNNVAKTYMYASVLSSSKNTFGTNDVANLQFAEATIGSELSLDISKLSGKYYIGFATLSERSFSVNNIRLV